MKSILAAFALLLAFALVPARAAEKAHDHAHDEGHAHDQDHVHDHEHAADAAGVKPKNLKRADHETLIYVGDMHCSACAKKVTSRLFRVKGVKQVRTDVAADLALVTPQAQRQLDPLALWQAVEKAGFPPTKLVGPAGTYERVEGEKAPQKAAEGRFGRAAVNSDAGLR